MWRGDRDVAAIRIANIQQRMCPNVGPMLFQRRRRWSSIGPTLALPMLWVYTGSCLRVTVASRPIQRIGVTTVQCHCMLGYCYAPSYQYQAHWAKWEVVLANDPCGVCFPLLSTSSVSLLQGKDKYKTASHPCDLRLTQSLIAPISLHHACVCSCIPIHVKWIRVSGLVLRSYWPHFHCVKV